MRKSIKNQENSANPLIRTLLQDIEKIEKEDFCGISNELSFIILMNLVLCYNKESLIDRYIKSQVSFLDVSRFNIATKEEWDMSEINDEFFSKFKPVFKGKKDRISFNREWRNRGGFNYSANQAFIYDISRYPVDSRTNRHIPTPIILKHLRNANAHGWIDFKDGKILLYDRKKKKQNPYIEISIEQEDMWRFLSHDVLYESMYTYIETFSGQRENEMFFFERAQSANDFEDYIRIYQLRFPEKTKKQVVDYLLDNHKICTYILEHPEQLHSVLDYKINENITIFQHSLRKSGMTLEEYNQRVKKHGDTDKRWARHYTYVAKKYMDSLKGYDIEFYKAYYCFLYNKDRIKGFLDYNNLSEDENELVEQGAKEIMAKLRISQVSMGKNPIILTEVMLTMFPEKDPTVFKDVIWAVESYNKFHKRIKPKIFTVLNVEKYSSLNRERNTGVAEHYKINERRRRIAQKGLMGAGIILAAQGLLAYASNQGVDFTFLKPAMAVGGLMGMMAIRNTLFWSANNFLQKYKDRKNRNDEEHRKLMDECDNPNFNEGGR